MIFKGRRIRVLSTTTTLHSYHGLRRRARITRLVSRLRIAILLRLRSRRLERLLEITNNVIDMLGADRNANKILR